MRAESAEQLQLRVNTPRQTPLPKRMNDGMYQCDGGQNESRHGQQEYERLHR
jgi:hypothetical protein